MTPLCRSAIAALSTLCLFATPTVTFMGKPYRLASFNQKASPMWEFTVPNETVDNWNTLLTIVDRPEARSRPDLDRLAQGVLDAYKSRGGRVLMAKTMLDSTGTPFNYMVAAFDQPAQHRFELNFVKAAMGGKNAYIAIYGVRVTDSKDYVGKAKAFLNEQSGRIGQELERAVLPPAGTLPRM